MAEKVDNRVNFANAFFVNSHTFHTSVDFTKKKQSFLDGGLDGCDKSQTKERPK